jgi:hypothetical protein
MFRWSPSFLRMRFQYRFISFWVLQMLKGVCIYILLCWRKNIRGILVFEIKWIWSSESSEVFQMWIYLRLILQGLLKMQVRFYKMWMYSMCALVYVFIFIFMWKLEVITCKIIKILVESWNTKFIFYLTMLRCNNFKIELTLPSFEWAQLG